MTTLGELAGKTLGELAAKRFGEFADAPGNILGPPLGREPMKRRAVRIIVTCANDHYNSITHGMAHAAADTIGCYVCGVLLPKADVRKARLGRAYPLNPR